MSFTKRLLVEDERKRQAAIGIAVRAGVLRRSKFGVCDELTEDHSEEMLKKAVVP
jgi:hypothetical protein